VRVPRDEGSLACTGPAFGPGRRRGRALAGACIWLASASPVLAQEGPPPAQQGQRPAAARRVDISEFRVEGAEHLSLMEIETVLEPFLGPGKVLEDVERAREALEKQYQAKGFHSVLVTIPPQTVRGGVLTLAVKEGKVGRLRVRGSRYFSLRAVKDLAPSVAEGTVPNFEGIVQDILKLNQVPDRRVTPSLRAGVIPGTVDVDLNVEDRFPLHGSLELNNRQSRDTAGQRLVGSLRFENLMQLGHALSLNFQVAPDSEGTFSRSWTSYPQNVLSLSYQARFPGVTWASLLFTGVIQDSDISTLGGVTVQGSGRMAGVRGQFVLPAPAGYFHTLAAGLDWRRFEEALAVGESTLETPVEYVPATAQYTGTWSGDNRARVTSVGATVLMNLRGLGSDPGEFDDKRYRASGNFAILRAELSTTQPLPFGAEVWARAQGQLASVPLLPSEQFTIGGASSVRGFLEAWASGDVGASGQLEVRSPSPGGPEGMGFVSEWRLHGFVDVGWNRLLDPLPEQVFESTLWGVGVGSRIRVFQSAFGSIEAAVPFEGRVQSRRLRWHFRVGGEL
jgi:hemolysin activation/secretion protein